MIWLDTILFIFVFCVLFACYWLIFKVDIWGYDKDHKEQNRANEKWDAQYPDWRNWNKED
jgi:hypothetical protein